MLRWILQTPPIWVLVGWLLFLGAVWSRPGPDSNYNRSVSGGGGSFAITAGTPSTVNGPQSAGAISMGTISYVSGCKYILIGIFVDNGGASAQTFGGVTVGGSAATHVGGSYVYGGLLTTSDFWYFPTPSGSSANITVTTGSAISGSPGAITVQTWSVSSTTAAPTLGYNAGPGFAASVTIPGVVVPSGGAVVGIGGIGGSTPSATFSNLTTTVVPYQTSDFEVGQSTSLSGTVSVTLTDSTNNGFWEESLVTIAP